MESHEEKLKTFLNKKYESTVGSHVIRADTKEKVVDYLLKKITVEDSFSSWVKKRNFEVKLNFKKYNS